MRHLRIAFAIMRKECLEMSRSMRWMWAASLIWIPLMQAQITRNYVRIADTSAVPDLKGYQEFSGILVSLTLILIAPVAMPTAISAWLQRTTVREQNLGVLTSVLATGVSHALLWTAKLIGAFVISYTLYLVWLAESVFVLYVVFGIPVTGTPSIWVAIFFSAPLLALGMAAITYFVCWTGRTATTLTGLVPALVCLVVVTDSFRSNSRVLAHPITMVHVGAALAVLLVIGLAMASNHLGKRRIVGL